MNKYQIMKGASLAKQTTYNTVWRLELIRWIRVAKTTQARTGDTSKEYVLTDLGKYRATQLLDDPIITKNLRSQLGDKNLEELDQRAKRARAIQIDELWAKIRPILISGRAPPGYECGLRVKANQQGKVQEKWYFKPFGIEELKRRLWVR